MEDFGQEQSRSALARVEAEGREERGGARVEVAGRPAAAPSRSSGGPPLVWFGQREERGEESKRERERERC